MLLLTAVPVRELVILYVLTQDSYVRMLICPRFVLTAHGVMAEKRKKNEFFRPSVEGILEDFLSGMRTASLLLLTTFFYIC